MRWLPSSLIGRTLLVLAAGMTALLAGSLVVNFFDRGNSVYRLTALIMAARIGQATRILDQLPADRRVIVSETIRGRHLSVDVAERALDIPAADPAHVAYAREFETLLRRQLGPSRALSVGISPVPRSMRAVGEGSIATPLEVWVARNFYFALPGTFAFVVQVPLADGTTAVFNTTVPQEPISRLESLAPRLLLLVAVCFAVAAVLARMTTRSLDDLASAAERLGRQPEAAPLPVRGPSEVRRVIHAFNAMQARLVGHLKERTQLLGAISHDLRTPITRLRLRVETTGDGEARERMLRDLDEMEVMVRGSLEFFQSIGVSGDRVPIDVTALADSICEDRRESGQDIAFAGGATAPYVAHAHALRRCIENLVDNAVRYSGAAAVRVVESPDTLSILVRDRGPGIPPGERERVFEPFYRMESSRNRDSGGVGLGLSIARNIARWHGGDVHLHDPEEGTGLVAEVRLPR